MISGTHRVSRGFAFGGGAGVSWRTGSGGSISWIRPTGVSGRGKTANTEALRPRFRSTKAVQLSQLSTVGMQASFGGSVLARAARPVEIGSNRQAQAVAASHRRRRRRRHFPTPSVPVVEGQIPTLRTGDKTRRAVPLTWEETHAAPGETGSDIQRMEIVLVPHFTFAFLEQSHGFGVHARAALKDQPGGIFSKPLRTAHVVWLIEKAAQIGLCHHRIRF